MARSKKYKRKQSAYTRERNKIMRKMRYWRKHGYEVNIELPPTEAQLRQAGVKGSDLRKATEILKKQNKQFAKEEYISISSGEVFSGQKEIHEIRETETKHAYDVFYDEIYEFIAIPIHYSRDRSKHVYELSITYQKGLMYHLRQLEKEYGKDAIGKVIIQHPELKALIEVVKYDSKEGEVTFAFYAVLEVFEQVTGQSLSLEDTQQIIDDAGLYEMDLPY